MTNQLFFALRRDESSSKSVKISRSRSRSKEKPQRSRSRSKSLGNLPDEDRSSPS